MIYSNFRSHRVDCENQTNVFVFKIEINISLPVLCLSNIFFSPPSAPSFLFFSLSLISSLHGSLFFSLYALFIELLYYKQTQWSWKATKTMWALSLPHFLSLFLFMHILFTLSLWEKHFCAHIYTPLLTNTQRIQWIHNTMAPSHSSSPWWRQCLKNYVTWYIDCILSHLRTSPPATLWT